MKTSLQQAGESLLDTTQTRERLLTKRQLAIKLGCTERTIDRWLALGILPSNLKLLIGNQTVRFKESAVDAWIHEQAPVQDEQPLPDVSNRQARQNRSRESDTRERPVLDDDDQPSHDEQSHDD